MTAGGSVPALAADAALDAEARSFFDRVNLIAALDHSGRAGNGFFLTVFDQHPELLTCAWMHYSYSYILTEFGRTEGIDSARAREVWTRKSYFRFVYNDLDRDLAEKLISFGGDPSAQVDRPRVRAVFDRLILARPTVTAKELLLYTYWSYGVGAGRDLSRTRYIMVSDAVSLRTESPKDGFSGRILEAIRKDFPEARIISLVRDPRATFASCRHQFVNANGNMYGLKPGNAPARLLALLRARLTPDECAWLYWFMYFAAAARTVFRLRQAWPGRFLFVRNEDLNLDFLPTAGSICAWLGIGESPQWRQPGYAPTMAGRPWTGTGAYNSRYQKKRHGPLKNDDQNVADKVTGPNAYVTERWRSRMAPHEIRLVDYLFGEEMRTFGYGPKEGAGTALGAALRVLKPFKGELPTWAWITEGRHDGPAEIGRRLFYAACFPPYYAASRLAFWTLLAGRFFGLGASAAAGSPGADWKAAP